MTRLDLNLPSLLPLPLPLGLSRPIPFITTVVMSALRLAARRLPRASKLVASVESPLQRRFAATSAAQAQVKVGAIAAIDRHIALGCCTCVHV